MKNNIDNYKSKKNKILLILKNKIFQYNNLNYFKINDM